MSGGPQPRVYLVDDDDAVRDSVGLLLRSVGLDVAGFPSATAFLDAGIRRQPPQCLLLDIRMPGMSGLELQRVLVREGLDLPVVFITGHGDVPMAVAAMKAGAFDFIEKPFKDQDLIDRVQAALETDRRAGDRVRERQRLAARLATLTPREREVLTHVVEGQANKAIAADLGVSERTVEVHRARVMHKMGARTLAELVRMVLAVAPPGADT